MGLHGCLWARDKRIGSFGPVTELEASHHALMKKSQTRRSEGTGIGAHRGTNEGFHLPLKSPPASLSGSQGRWQLEGSGD